MRISIIGKNIEISEHLRKLATDKVQKLDKYFPENTEAHVAMSVERYRHIVEVTIPYSGGIIRGEEVTGDMYESIDRVLDKLEHQIVRYRTKLEKNLRAGAFKQCGPELLEHTEDGEEPEEKRVVKVKHFNLKPMTVDEAMLQMELLGHSFYMFTNGETSQVNVIYQRKDGNYGLIEPEY